MNAEWASVEIREHSPRGTLVHRGVFPLSLHITMQMESQASIMAQLMESWLNVHLGHAVEVEVSYSECTLVELGEWESAAVRTLKKAKGAKRWQRHFEPASLPMEANNGEAA